MNNEPVAWMLLGLEDRKPKLINLQVIEHLEGTWIPLYTHPADLTDEYCKAYWGKDNCFVDVFLPNSETEVIRFWNDQLNESYKPKTLTDEEIDKLWHSDEFYEEWTDGSISAIHYNKFARAILRKAQNERK